jgi:predicted phage-related endonuclease
VTVAQVTTLSPERIALRQQHVGASEVAALFGEHPFLTRFKLWHLKNGTLPSDDLSDNERVFWGVMLENGIGAGVAAKTGWKLQRVTDYCRHSSIAGMGASPDFEVLDDPRGRGTVQVKNVDGLVYRDGWNDGAPPMHFQLQVQHEIACGGYAWGALAALVGGNRLAVFEYDRHDGAIARIEAEVAEFWRTIREQEAPEPDFGRDLEALQKLYSATALGEVLDLSGDAAFARAGRRYLKAGKVKKFAEEIQNAAKAELLTIVKAAAVSVGDGVRVTTFDVDECEVHSTRSAYRGMRVTAIGAAKASKKAKKTK